jgi:hypothetical protein
MTTQPIVTARFEWVKEAVDGLVRALGEDIMIPDSSFTASVDPLKWFVHLKLWRPMAKKSREPFRDYLRAWAKIWDCELSRIIIEDRTVVVETLIKHRILKGVGHEGRVG